MSDGRKRHNDTLIAKRHARIEDAQFLRGMGEHPDHIAARVGVCRDRLDGYLRAPVPAPCEPGDDGDLSPSPVPALEPERRIARAKPLAADLARCVAASDAEGVRILLQRAHRAGDWEALVIVLAECADPGRTAVVTSRQDHHREGAGSAAA